LRTVEAVDTIFSSEKPLLPQLLRELEQPSSTAPSSSSDLKTTKLEPILTTLPNFPTLSRHLPSSILSYNPFLSSTSSGLSNDAISQALATWLESSTTALISGVDEWITSLSTSENTALSLSSLRDSITAQLNSVPPSSASQAHALQSKLLELIESRLSQVYVLKLSQLVSNLSPSLESLLSKLSTKDHLAENDSSQFLFSIEMPHLHQPPIASKYSEQRLHPADPFGAFLNKVGKRVDGRTPLVDSGLEELEKSAREIRGDLKSWLSDETSGTGTGERELRKRYVNEVEKTLESLVDVLEQVLEGEEKNEENGKLITVFSIIPSLLIFDYTRQVSVTRSSSVLSLAIFLSHQLSLETSFSVFLPHLRQCSRHGKRDSVLFKHALYNYGKRQLYEEQSKPFEKEPTNPSLLEITQFKVQHFHPVLRRISSSLSTLSYSLYMRSLCIDSTQTLLLRLHSSRHSRKEHSRWL